MKNTWKVFFVLPPFDWNEKQTAMLPRHYHRPWAMPAEHTRTRGHLVYPIHIYSIENLCFSICAHCMSIYSSDLREPSGLEKQINRSLRLRPDGKDKPRTPSCQRGK